MDFSLIQMLYDVVKQRKRLAQKSWKTTAEKNILYKNRHNFALAEQFSKIYETFYSG